MAWSTRCSMCRRPCPPRSIARITAITRIRRRSSSTTRCCTRPIRCKQRALMRQFEKYVLDEQSAQDLDVVVVPDRAVPVLCEGLEDQPDALYQPGSGDDLARQISDQTEQEEGNEDPDHILRRRWSALSSSRRPLVALAEETPKHGGTLTYMIPADAPPSFDGAPREHLRDDAFGRAVLQRADPGQSRTTRPRRPTSSAICAPRCRSRPTAARPTPSRSATASSSTTARR